MADRGINVADSEFMGISFIVEIAVPKQYMAGQKILLEYSDNWGVPNIDIVSHAC